MHLSIESDQPARLAQPKLKYARFLTLCVCLTATLVASVMADRRKPDSLSKPLEGIAPEIQGWNLVERQALPPAQLGKLRPSSYVSRIYQRGDRNLGLFIAYYAQQHSGESMHSPKVCLPGNGWDIVKQESATVQIHGKPLPVNRYHIQNSGVHMLVFYWYQSPQRIVANEFLGKALLIKDALLGGATGGSIVRITLPDDAAALQEGPEFAQRLIPEVQRCFAN
jgi:EpsI family protein